MRYNIFTLFLLSAFPLFGMQSRSMEINNEITKFEKESKRERLAKNIFMLMNVNNSLLAQLCDLSPKSEIAQSSPMASKHLAKKIEKYQSWAATLLASSHDWFDNKNKTFFKEKNLEIETYFLAYTSQKESLDKLYHFLCTNSANHELEKESKRSSALEPLHYFAQEKDLHQKNYLEISAPAITSQKASDPLPVNFTDKKYLTPENKHYTSSKPLPIPYNSNPRGNNDPTSGTSPKGSPHQDLIPQVLLDNI